MQFIPTSSQLNPKVWAKYELYRDECMQYISNFEHTCNRKCIGRSLICFTFSQLAPKLFQSNKARKYVNPCIHIFDCDKCLNIPSLIHTKGDKL